MFLLLGFYWDNGTENGNYRDYIEVGFYWDNGKEKGNYYSGFRVQGSIPVQ